MGFDDVQSSTSWCHSDHQHDSSLEGLSFRKWRPEPLLEDVSPQAEHGVTSAVSVDTAGARAKTEVGATGKPQTCNAEMVKTRRGCIIVEKRTR